MVTQRAPRPRVLRRSGRSRVAGMAVLAANAALVFSGCVPGASPATVRPPAERQAAASSAAIAPGPASSAGGAAPISESRSPLQPPTVHAAALPAPTVLEDARARLIDGDYRRAQQDFASIATTYPGTAEATEALLRQGEAALMDENYGIAQDALRRFIAANQDHPLRPLAQLLLGQAQEAQQDGGAAAYTYAQYMASVDPSVTLGDFLHLRTADIYFAAGRALDAWNELALAAADADASGSSAARVRVYDAIATHYSEAGLRAEAVTSWQVALDAAVAAKQPARDLAPMAWRMVSGYQAMGRRDLADALRRRIIAEWPATFNALQALNDLGPSAASAYTRATIYYANRRWPQTISVLTDYINGGAPEGHMDEARYMRAIALTRSGDDDALDALDRVASLHPDSQWAPEALWEAGSLLLRKGDQPAALNRFEKLAVGYPNSERRGQALYWLGKLLPQLGNSTSGRQYMEAAAASGFEDFYTFRARAALGRPAPAPKPLENQEQISESERQAWQQWLAGHGRPDEDQAQRRAMAEGDNRYKRGLALIAAGFQKEGEAELSDLLAAWQNDPVVVADVALAVRDLGYYPYSVTLGHRLMDALEQMGQPSFLEAPRVVQKLVLPLAFIRLVQPAAEAKRLDPLLLLGLMKQESWFQPHAASSAQARGLTQFIYDTAKTVATELKWPDWTWDDMNKPYVSVPFGAHYLSSLIRDFRGNYYFAVAGYNGGPGNVLGWAKGDWNRDADLFVEGIGYSETRAYVKAVTGNYELYKAIYYR